MGKSALKPEVTIVGGGMITQVQILPSLYQLQRLGLIGKIKICALNAAPLRTLAEDASLAEAFPGLSFQPFPDFAKVGLNEKFPDLYQKVIADQDARNIVVVAVPDQLHYDVLNVALEADQHVLCVKPLVLEYAQAAQIEKKAYERGLLIGIEYHKRFDDRSLMARQAYRAGRFGQFRIGQAHLVECWYYRHSNFQNWCTRENSDMFAYIGCHYVDLVHFITGLLPTAVSVYGVVDKYPNGNEAFMWTDGRVIWENGACLSVMNGLGYPDDGPGGNSQGLMMFGQGDDIGTLIYHSDQYRGVKYAFTTKGADPGETVYAEPSPDYFKLLDLGGPGRIPVGYGFRSIDYIVRAAIRVETETEDLAGRQKLLRQFDQAGIMATPANSAYNELVMEAGRKSILAGGREVAIQYGERPGVAFRKYD